MLHPVSWALCVLLLAGALPARALAGASVLLIGIGGNSECFDDEKGIRGLAKSNELRAGLASALGARVDMRYFSWTGDAEGHAGCLPGHWDWVMEGSRHIQAGLRKELGDRRYRRLVIVGWSNGGATAYELACDLSKAGSRRVSLLVTFDPASWTTRPCRLDGDPETPVRPASLWVSVYTKSDGSRALDISNIIGLLGNAWDDRFPPAREQADSLIKLEPADHGHARCMWRLCVLNDGRFMSWSGGRRSTYAYPPKDKYKMHPGCHMDAACVLQAGRHRP